MNNPFYYGGVVSDIFFCNRSDEIKELKQDIINGQNILIYAPRRFGKTSLILKTLKELESDSRDFKYIFVDLMSITSKEEFINIYFNAIANSFETSSDKIVRFFKQVLKIRPNIKIVFDEYGHTKFSLEFFKKDTMDVLEEVLNIPLKYSEKQKLCIVFDEFQEIENIGIEAKLRSVIQHHTNKLSYVFLGSKKSILDQMFKNKNRPFYKSVKHFSIGEIKSEEWEDFIFSKFIETEKQIQKVYIKKILDITKGFPYYTQQFAYELWNLTEKNVDDEIFEKSKRMLLNREKEIFLTEWDNLTLNQKKAIKIVVETGGKNIYDEELLAKYEIKASSLQTAIKNLIQKDVIDKKETYYLQDPLFEYWIEESF
ncbi:AAA family ATPase [Nitrosophilus alvini]|uniref:AAA family ATPase n=1 Tax=Nitrosophilus alvini TaxID=2714855 RepID=UPI00190CA9E4|nr:ATP-binding protein [Nitrosophilus alvini]